MSASIPRAIVAEALLVDEDTLPAGDLPVDRLAERYLAHIRAWEGEHPPPDDHPDGWSTDVFFELTWKHAALGLVATVAALSACETPEEVAFVSAGPLEDLIADHGATLIDEIEARAAGAPRFAYALTGVWPQGKAGTLLWARIEAARRDVPGLDEGAELPPPDGLD